MPVICGNNWCLEHLQFVLQPICFSACAPVDMIYELRFGPYIFFDECSGRYLNVLLSICLSMCASDDLFFFVVVLVGMIFDMCSSRHVLWCPLKRICFFRCVLRLKFFSMCIPDSVFRYVLWSICFSICAPVNMFCDVRSKRCFSMCAPDNIFSNVHSGRYVFSIYARVDIFFDMCSSRNVL